MNDSDAFDRLETTLKQLGPAAMLQDLCVQLEQEERYHELFEAMKLRIRHQLGLPLWSTQPNEIEPGELRDRLENGLLDACRHVGSLLLKSGRIRDAWTYLRPLGDLPQFRKDLATIEATEENAGELIEIYLQEGLDLERGFSLLLKYYGTCNTITTYDTSMYGQPRAQRAIGARLLLRQIHEELRLRLADHLQRISAEAEIAASDSVSELLNRQPQLMAEGAYHIDTTHLASVTRIARNTQDAESWKLARELCQYGQALDAHLQYQDAAPFEQIYTTSDRYFSAMLGENQQEHLDYFRERAELTDPYHETTFVRETYIDLLARCGLGVKAWEEAIRLLPAGMQTTGLAPSMLELAELSQRYDRLCELARERQDRLTYALGLVASSEADV